MAEKEEIIEEEVDVKTIDNFEALMEQKKKERDEGL
jgi:hypothetical protein